MTEGKKGGKLRSCLAVIGAVVVLGMCGVVVMVALGGIGDDGPEKVGPGDVPAAPVGTVPAFDEVEETVEGMTEVQWKAYLDGLKGQRIENWTGWIVEVDQGLGGNYTVWIDMDEPGEISTQDVYCPVSEDLAMSLNLGDKVRFSGTVERASEMLRSISFTLGDDATLEVVE